MTDLEIILPVRNPGVSLIETAESIATQTDRRLNVLLSDNHSTEGIAHIDAADKKLSEAGVIVRRVKPPSELAQIEHWNWSHAQSQAGWLKPLLAGERLKPHFVEHFKQRIAEKPQAQVIRCDMVLQTEWGPEKQLAPFQYPSITRAEFLNHFPSHMGWLSHSANFAYTRTAWLELGGFSKHVPANTALNLNVMLALHHGLENLPETLVEADATPRKESGRRTCQFTEIWLILLQARNYCLAAKLPWTEDLLFLRSLSASLKRW